VSAQDEKLAVLEGRVLALEGMLSRMLAEDELRARAGDPS
jgi:hypothetical protein